MGWFSSAAGNILGSGIIGGGLYGKHGIFGTGGAESARSITRGVASEKSRLEEMFLNEPGLERITGPNWIKRSQAYVRADTERAVADMLQNIRGNLAARGGGGIASALEMGAAARQPMAGMRAQATQQGLGMEQTALQAKYGPLLGLFTGLSGFMGSAVGAQAQMQSAQTMSAAKIWSSIINKMGGSTGGGGNG